ncbi:hypothetical protein IID27_03365, partial [Patescibacteria group bacterium]|nr:hypothetical protein [Patescibacteria group bacterium]
MKKILLSLSMIVFAGAIIAGATGAFFSDTETSTGNTFTAGAIDLGIDNTSYYNGVAHDGTTWSMTFDLDESGELFFNFSDIKPGDYGEDTISIHINNNEAWLCADVTLVSDNDNTCTEPENDVDAENGIVAREKGIRIAEIILGLFAIHNDGFQVIESGVRSRKKKVFQPDIT